MLVDHFNLVMKINNKVKRIVINKKKNPIYIK